MNQRTRSNDIAIRREDADGRSTLVADFGPGAAVSADVVEGTAIVVLETEEGTRQREFDVPAGDAEAFTNNGVVTVEVER
jgi:hypothetical protein